MRSLSLFTFFAALPLLLISCAPPPSPTTGPEDQQLALLKQQQAEMAQEMQKLRAELALLRGETPGDVGAQVPQAPGEGLIDLPADAPGREMFRQAFLAFSEGRYAQSIEGFQQFISDNPDSPFRLGAYYWMGHSYAGMGKPDKAVMNFEQVLWESPQYSRAPAILVHMMTLYQRMNQPEKAKQARSILASRYPDSAETRRAMALTIEPAQEPIEGKQ